MKELKKYQDYFIIFFICLVSCIILSKLFINPRYLGHDTVFHSMNIISLSETVSLNNLLGDDIVKITANKFGYGIWLFYPKIPHLLGAYLYLLLQDIYLTMKIIYFLTMFLSGVVFYILAQNLFQNKLTAVLATIIYMTYPYHMSEIYVRDAFAENFIFLILPIIFLGLEYLKQNKIRLFYICFTGGYIIGIHSHLLSMVFLTMFVIIYLIYYKHIFFTKTNLIRFIISSLIIFAISAPYIINIIEHRLANIYSVYLHPTFTSRNIVADNVLDIYNLYGYNEFFNKIATYCNPVVLILLSASVFVHFLPLKTQKFTVFIYSIIFSLILLCSQFFWLFLAPGFMIMIQYPFRILLFLAFFISLYSVSIFANIYNSKFKYKKILTITQIAIIISCISFSYYEVKYYKDFEVNIIDVKTEKNKKYIYSQLGTRREYLPFVCSMVCSENGHRDWCFRLLPYKITNDKNLTPEIIKDDFPNLQFQFSKLQNKLEITLPRTYYLGYYLFNEKKEEIKLTINEYGMLSATIDEGGIYNLEYKGTLYERIGRWIRYVTFLLLLFLFIIDKYRKELKKKPL